MTTLYLLAAGCVGVSLVTAILRVTGHRRQSFATKCTACLLFCLTAALAANQRALPMNRSAALLLTGLALGVVGDIFLGLAPLMKKERYNLFSVLGGVPFFIGHLFFIAALLADVPLRLPLLALLPVLPALYFLLHKAECMDLGKNLYFVMAYGTVLGGMLVASVNLALYFAQGPWGGLPMGILMWFPGIFFAVSDTSLFLRNYGSENVRRFVPVFEFSVMLPYFAAQAIFALAVAYV